MFDEWLKNEELSDKRLKENFIRALLDQSNAQLDFGNFPMIDFLDSLNCAQIGFCGSFLQITVGILCLFLHILHVYIECTPFSWCSFNRMLCLLIKKKKKMESNLDISLSGMFGGLVLLVQLLITYIYFIVFNISIKLLVHPIQPLQRSNYCTLLVIIEVTGLRLLSGRN